MRILVPVKRVIDPNIKIRLKADGSGVDMAGTKMTMNPFDEIAVEEALRLREAGLAREVIAVTVGPGAATETLRGALAMGADRAIHVVTDQRVEPLGVASVLEAVIRAERADLVIMGKQAIDDDMNATGQMLAARMGWPQGTFASALSVKDGEVRVTREVDGGLETLALALPAIITADLRLNEPRYASLPNIMKAKKKPIEVKPAADFGLDLSPRLEVMSVTAPPVRASGVRVNSVNELADRIRQIAGAAQ